MWAIRILTGPQAGKIVPLQTGVNRIGRSSPCEVRINLQSVSKIHAQITVTEDKAILSDNDSRNGTFVNGVRIQHHRLATGEKIAVHDGILEFFEIPAAALAAYQARQQNALASNSLMTPQSFNQGFPPPSYGNSPPPYYGEGAAPQMQMGHPPPSQMQQPQMQANSLGDLFKNFQLYFDNVVMPGVYNFAQVTQYRYAIAAFVGTYLVLVTTLATVPMIRMTKASIQKESGRRALSIARNLAVQNAALKEEAEMNTSAADKEEGVTSAYIISSKDGHALAPFRLRGEYPNKPFIHSARTEDHELVSEIDSSTVGASVPIRRYNAMTGSSNDVIAYAMVIYDMGSSALNTSQTFTLFIQILGIAIGLGIVLYFFLYKVIEHPLVVLNTGLSDALREGRDDLQTPYDFPVLKELIGNISSALSRVNSGSSHAPVDGVPLSMREQEAMNILRVIGVPGIAISAIDQNILGTNEKLNRLIGGGVELRGRPVSTISDSALQKNINEMLPQLKNAPMQIGLSEIPFGGELFEVSGQAVMGSSEPVYYLICFQKQGGGD